MQADLHHLVLEETNPGKMFPSLLTSILCHHYQKETDPKVNTPHKYNQTKQIIPHKPTYYTKETKLKTYYVKVQNLRNQVWENQQLRSNYLIGV